MNSTYDAVIAENALHHAQDVPTVVGRLQDRLRPGGLLILRDYVGPSRFQWSHEQLRYAANLLAEVPPRLRIRWNTSQVKTRHYRTGSLAMRLTDPSEAAMSDSILPTLRSDFEQLMLKPIGGTLLQLVFDDIAHHFVEPDQEARDVLEHCIETESALISAGKLPSDFVFGVFRRKEQQQ